MNDTITNQNKFECEYYELVNEIELAIADIIRDKIIKSHNENIAYGMKFNYKDNDLDIAINNHVFKNGFNSNIENVLNEIDIQNQY
jgi:hypothetical protein